MWEFKQAAHPENHLNQRCRAQRPTADLQASKRRKVLRRLLCHMAQIRHWEREWETNDRKREAQSQAVVGQLRCP